MNILFAADVSIARVCSGAERVLFEQATRLAAAGYAVHLLTRFVSEIHTHEREEISGVIEWRYQADPKHPFGFVVDTFRNAGRLFQELHQDIGFDCLLFHQPLSACAVLFSGKCASIKKIYICHSLWHEEYLSRTDTESGFFQRQSVPIQALIRKWMEKKALNGSDRIVALSGYTREKLQRSHGIAADKISIVPGGVDLKRFSPVDDKAFIRRRLDLPVNRTVLFTLRNLEPRMGLFELLSAMKMIVDHHLPEAYLVIGGDGPLRQSLVDQTVGSGLNSHVSFTGFIDEALLPDYYRMADLFILPTLELEGFGLVTLEAMASGAPVLGTPVGGTREILQAFDANFLFEDTSPEAMAALIVQTCRRLTADPGAYAQLRRQVRSFVESRFSWDRHIKSILALSGITGG